MRTHYQIIGLICYRERDYVLTDQYTIMFAKTIKLNGKYIPAYEAVKIIKLYERIIGEIDGEGNVNLIV